jgi:transcriptional regulator of acetoin/glycerol metabolism
MELLRALTSCERRPNLLVDCVDGGAEAVLTQLQELCVGPFYGCQLPGVLELPEQGSGTLLLNYVAALTIAQQVALFDWLHQQKGTIQVVSLTQKRLLSLVCDGRFLEGLFYRLNTISITARGAR